LVSQSARENNVIVNAVDKPNLCDFYFPAVARRGSIRVGVCTDGRSPLMSKLIKEHIQVHITEKDVLGVDLQDYSRNIAKMKIPGQGNRRDALYKVAKDPYVQSSLAKGNLPEAKVRAMEVLEAFQESAGTLSESKGE